MPLRLDSRDAGFGTSFAALVNDRRESDAGVATDVAVLAPPEREELEVLRDLHRRTREANSRPVKLPV